ncbi:hypothetical protein DFH08DRAFT_849256 [Mycena albidolilacea]|uniref:Endoplasmic reticulum junction formation protein lunapark n=1 Tax=Mycena albidolilacea TaxID=1033008 RepID=A0AAD7AE40_9AGAR|nr:hypothetical protein DFH08DRAFT_849256 [Mycena albidolilacea]
MSFIWRLFRSEKPPDDETVLASLARDIQRRQTLLADIRARERTATALATLYTLAGWIAYVGFWYFGFVSGGGARTRGVERALRALPVFIGPILILFIRRIVQIWYARKGNAEEKTLQTLLKAQRAKVEEIKKKTNFYETRDLLSRYERGDSPSDSSPSPSSNSKPNANGAGPGSISSPNTPQRAGPGTPGRAGGPRPSAIGVPGAGAGGGPQQPPPPPQPHRRGWFDAFADVLVGPDDTPQIDKEKQKFALICAKCFSHNGLVPEVVWADAQYTCPKCGHFNPSARNLGLLASNVVSPSSRNLAPGPGLPPPSPLPVSPLSTMSFAPPPPTPSKSTPSAVRQRSALARGGSDDEEDDGQEMEVDS